MVGPLVIYHGFFTLLFFVHAFAPRMAVFLLLPFQQLMITRLYIMGIRFSPPFARHHVFLVCSRGAGARRNAWHGSAFIYLGSFSFAFLHCTHSHDLCTSDFLKAHFRRTIGREKEEWIMKGYRK